MLDVDAPRIASKMARPIRSYIMKIVDFEVHKNMHQRDSSSSKKCFDISKSSGTLTMLQQVKKESPSFDVEVFERILNKAKNLGW